MTFDEWYARRLAGFETAILMAALRYTHFLGLEAAASTRRTELSGACDNYRTWFNDKDTLRTAWVSAGRELHRDG
jgi:hypothetical protein